MANVWNGKHTCEKQGWCKCEEEWIRIQLEKAALSDEMCSILRCQAGNSAYIDWLNRYDELEKR